MAKWINRSLIQAPRNGTTTHTVAFTPATAGNLLVMVMEGAVTHTVPTGWTRRNQALNSTELSVYTKTATGGESSFSTTHNGGNYPIAVVVYEFPAGTTWSGGISATGVSTGGANPNLTGLTGTNLAIAAAAAVVSTAPGTATWSTPTGITEDVDVSVGGGATDGYLLTVAYIEDHAGSSFQPGGSISFSPFGGKETLTFAVKVPAGTTPPHYEWDADLTVDVALSGVLAPYFTWVANTEPDAVLAAVTVPAFGWDAPLTVDAVLSGSLAPSFTWGANTAPNVTLTGSTAPHFSWTATMDVDVELTAETSSDRAWSATFTPDVQLTGETAPHFAWDATFAADVGLTTNTVPAFTWDAVFTPGVDLTATLTRARSWYHIFTADVNLAATARPHFAWTSTATIEVSLTDQPQEPNMSVPSPDWGLVLMKWAGVYLDGTPCTGRIKVSFNKPAGLDAKAPMLDDDPETPLSIYVAATIDVQLTTKTVLYGGSPRPVGYAEFWVPATDDPDITDSAGNPLTGGTYTCTEALGRGAGQTPFKFVAPIATGPDGLWLNKIEHVA